MKQKQSLLSVAARHDENNLRTAREILADPEAWGGKEAGMVVWARAVVARLVAEKTIPPENGSEA